MKNKTYSVATKVQVSCMCLPKDGHAHPARNRNLIRFLQSFVVLPVITIAVPFGGLVGAMKADTVVSPQIVVSTTESVKANPVLALNEILDQKVDQKAEMLDAEAKAIDAYFKAHDMPLEGHGMGMAIAAEKYGLDYRLLAAIAVRETTGGRKACPVAYSRTGDIGYQFNVFGWGSCKIKFKSYEDAFEVLAKNLSGNNPNTARHYDGKTTRQMLQKYNPPEVVAKYADQVMGIMDDIGKEDMTPETPLAVAKT